MSEDIAPVESRFSIIVLVRVHFKGTFFGYKSRTQSHFVRGQTPQLFRFFYMHSSISNEVWTCQPSAAPV